MRLTKVVVSAVLSLSDATSKLKLRQLRCILATMHFYISRITLIQKLESHFECPSCHSTCTKVYCTVSDVYGVTQSKGVQAIIPY